MSWRVQDGFFATGPVDIAQTRDGYIWIATYAGLLQFDGVHFFPWSGEHGQQLPSSEVIRLMAAADGSLWIATRAGLSRWKDHALTNYPSVPGGVVPILEDSKGKIWFGQNVAMDGTGPLCQVVGTTTRCYGATDGAPTCRGARDLLEDRTGDLWIACDQAVVRWNPRSHSVHQLAAKSTTGNGIDRLAFAPDGTLWVAIRRPGAGFGLERLIEGRWSPLKTGAFDSSTLSVQALYADRQGALWIGTFDRGIYRVDGNQIDHFDSTSGLSGNWVVGFTEDREGNLWVATTSGADRFADTPVISRSSKEGLCSNEAASIAASRDGSVWVGGAEALSHVRGQTVSCIRTDNGLPGRQVTSLLEDHAGRLWVGLDEGLWLYNDGAFREIRRPDGKPTSMVMGIAEDARHTIWITVAGPPRILMRLQGLVAREESPAPEKPRKVAADPMGGIWLGLLNGDLAHYANGKQETFRFTHDSAALVNQLVANADGSVFAAASYGLIGWYRGKPVTLDRRNGLPSDDIYALTFDSGGNLWLFMDSSLGEISKKDLQMWLKAPDAKVFVKTFDALDGVRTGRPPFDGAARSSDGRLWFVNDQVAETIDPDHLRGNSVPPPVYVDQVIADRKNYQAEGILRLPPRIRDLEIDYAGLSFVAPQKVRFRYWLEGRDESWQEPGTRRQAFYNDLRPGRYRFQVIACNNDGLWNEEGAALDFVIAPAFDQTIWFQSVCAIAFLTFLWGLYRYRLYQLAREFNLRSDERVGERTRIARELHDTLLQSFQGSLFEFQAARNLFPRRQEDAIRTMDGAISSAETAIAEGRDAIQNLRSVPGGHSDLAHLLTAAGKDLSAAQDSNRNSAAFRLTVEGAPQTLSPILQDEIYRIGREILRNAFRHARAGKIEVEIRYDDRMLRLRFRDDGIGIDPKVLEQGARPGHWGLPGVRERAKLAGAQLDFWGEAGAGTEVQISVPAEVAYTKSRNGRVLGLFRKTKRSHAD